jgi:hypothetical protein
MSYVRGVHAYGRQSKGGHSGNGLYDHYVHCSHIGNSLADFVARALCGASQKAIIQLQLK